ncbi:Periplasmic pH-dependent serine endoprotease DegQ [Andreprevotia sp. IGB-42]|uniref:DegQ family serine endoprotease n=1 Tax=Andreprevotia sp. IGB-42 TaxID=2497473 RepID=UPI0013588E60|nr:DegQ family serine endoprotease [Andreprevotia sp. IGB-42]KAF0814201.1 Periplasmic pH-dependent serine endoprotease DegQ [Andreprevotia sp. IGB-42]
MIKNWIATGLLTFGFTAAAQAAAPASLPDFTQLVEKEGKAVVNISTTATITDQAQFGGDEDVLDLFRRFGFPTPPGGRGQQGQPQERQTQSLGSGFIIESGGYILTNAHVIAQADEIKVKLTDKREFKAKVIGSDARTDVALLKIEATNLPKVDLGSAEKLKVGEWVAAIGAPFGFENSVTAGIVSAKGRSLPDETFVPFIQTDVAINPGNSGGPLFNLAGEVVGINSQIYSRSGGFMGLSFSIPIDVAMKVAEELKATGHVTRGRIGVTIQDVTEELAKSFGLPKAGGALLSSIEKDGPADKAGLKPGDIIQKFNGQPIATPGDLPRLVTATKPGTQAKVQVWRDRATRDVTLTVGQLDAADKASKEREYKGGQRQEDSNRFGLTVRELNARELKQLGLKFGLVVQAAAGAAGRAGLQQGDVLAGIGNSEVTSMQQLRNALNVLKPGETIALRVIRGDGAQFLTLKAPEKADK